MIVTRLQAHYGWEGLGERIRVNCFHFDPSIKSSLKFLRKTPWARTKVEQLYLDSLRDMQLAEEGRAQSPAAPEPQG